MILYRFGDILSSGADIICQQVNCQDTMGSGLAKEIRDNFPSCYEGYKMFRAGKTPSVLLGKVNWVQDNHGPIFANIFAQLRYGRSEDGHFSYTALRNGLTEVCTHAMAHNRSVAIPHGISCGCGGGDWEIVSNIIEEVFGGGNVRCEVWKLQ